MEIHRPSNPLRLVPPSSAALSALLVLTAFLPSALAQGGRNTGLGESNRVGGMIPGMEAEPGDLALRETPIVRAVRKAKDSVVNVYLTRDIPARYGGGSQVEGQGSGVIIDATGLVITNWHVTLASEARGDGIVCALNDGTSYPARLLSSSDDYDLALLALDLPAGERVQPVALGDSDSLMIGETVVAIGNPQGKANSVTAGVLSAVDREITVLAPDGRSRTYEGLLQTDAAINQGNSGGALLDITGKLIGINNAMQRNVENIGFAIPVNRVRKVFDEILLSADNLQNVWLGMSVEFEDTSPILRTVAPNGPAAQAGLRPGDRLVSLGGRRIAKRSDYLRAVAEISAADRTPVEVERGDRSLEASLRAMSRSQFEIWRRIGARFEQVAATDDEGLVRRASIAYGKAARMRPRMLQGVLRVEAVDPEGPAGEIGLEPGDVLVAIQGNGTFGLTRAFPSLTNDYFADQLRGFAGSSIVVYVLRGEKELEGEMFVRRL